MGRIEVDQHRYELKALIDSEKPSKGSVRGHRQICLDKDKAASMLQSPREAYRRWLTSRGEVDGRRISQDRFAGYLKLRRGRSRRDGLLARRDRSGDPEDVREARHPLGRGHRARVHGF